VFAEVVELADAADSKSAGSVFFRKPAPHLDFPPCRFLQPRRIHRYQEFSPSLASPHPARS